LCEKPITDQHHELKQLEKKYDKYNNKVIVAHVLRYTPFFNKIKEIIKSKIIGRVRFINLLKTLAIFIMHIVMCGVIGEIKKWLHQ